MIEVRCNFKGNYKDDELLCPICRTQLDTTKHIFECEKIIQKEKIQVHDIKT